MTYVRLWWKEARKVHRNPLLYVIAPMTCLFFHPLLVPLAVLWLVTVASALEWMDS